MKYIFQIVVCVITVFGIQLHGSTTLTTSLFYRSISDIQCPNGYTRTQEEPNSFGTWLRKQTLKQSNDVYLYNGMLKANQTAQFAVLDIEIGKQDLQQCADACMRLRAEYLFATNQKDKIRFRFTNGTDAKFSEWIKGYRPHLKGNKVSWTKDAKYDDSYTSLRQFLIPVFRFCGTASLEKELPNVYVKDIQIGDVIIKGGFPGHAIMVVDMTRNSYGKTMVMVAQSYMPAQDIHVLRNPANPSSPWFEIGNTQTFETPEWTFTNFPNQIRRFR